MSKTDGILTDYPMTTQDNDMVPSINEVEDLTQFADESFDTDEVDLFEFTGVDDSPLTRLKSIILSLDWEISDDILDELIQEVDSLRSTFKEDKVAQVYLQGLGKVGNYLQREGAYAHQNANKLLFTLFYNYEKIISSPDISGEDITTLLKSDIRKFKVLQFQIDKIGPTPAGSAGQVIAAPKDQKTPETENKFLADIEATILSLEWEVTEEDLDQFKQQANELGDHLPDDKLVDALLKGLQALGAYIGEEKVDAHPDAFTLLLSFYDGLKILVTDKDIDTEKRQEIVIDRVSRLNSLKEILAAVTTTEPVDRAVDEVDMILDFASDDNVVEDQPAGAQEAEDEMDAKSSLSDDDELDFDRVDQKTADNINAAMETADELYPDDILDPEAIHPVSDELADDFIEEELKLSTSFAPDSASEEAAEHSLKVDGLSKEDLDEELDLLYSDDKASDAELEGLELSLDDESGDLETDLQVELADIDMKGDDSLDFDENLFLSEDDAAQAVGENLFLSEDDEAQTDDEELFLSEDDEAQTDDEELFLSEDDEAQTDDQNLVTPALGEADDQDLVTPALSEADEQDLVTPALGEADDQDLVTPALSEADEQDHVTPALGEADEQVGFSEEVASTKLAVEPANELEDKLNSFFGISEEEQVSDPADAALSTQQVDHETEDTMVSALADADEDFDSGFREEEIEAELVKDSSDVLQDKLDSFFGSDAEPETEIVAAQESKTGTEEPLEEEADSFFVDDETSDAEQELAETEPALTDAGDISGFDEQEEVAGLVDSSMEDIDDKLDSFFDEDKKDSALKAPTSSTVFSSLTTAASTLSPSPSPDDFKRVAELVVAGKEETTGGPQTVLLTLIDSAVAILLKNPEAAAENNTIVQKLVAGLEDADNPVTLTETVQQYTSWQQTFFDAIKSNQKSIETTAPSPAVEGVEDDITLQVQAGFSQLRKTMMEEFDNIRKELKPE